MPHRLGLNRIITHVHYLLGIRMSVSARKIVEMSTHVSMLLLYEFARPIYFMNLLPRPVQSTLWMNHNLDG